MNRSSLYAAISAITRTPLEDMLEPVAPPADTIKSVQANIRIVVPRNGLPVPERAP